MKPHLPRLRPVP